MKKTCGIISYMEVPAAREDDVRRALHREIGKVLEESCRILLARFSQGADMLVARCILEYKAQYPDIYFEAIVPNTSHAERFDRDTWELLSKCSALNVHGKDAKEDNALGLTRYLIEQSDQVIVLYGDPADDDTLFSLDYARTMERDTRIITTE